MKENLLFRKRPDVVDNGGLVLDIIYYRLPLQSIGCSNLLKISMTGLLITLATVIECTKSMWCQDGVEIRCITASGKLVAKFSTSSFAADRSSSL